MKTALLARLAGRPMALAPRVLEGMLALDRQARGPLPATWDEDPDASGYSVTEDGIAVVPVLGPLLTRGDWLTALLGASDYGTIGRTLEAAFADASVRAVVMEMDSPGGEVGGLFDLVDRIGALRESSSKPLWAVAGEAALSAAYAIASAAGRIYVTRTGEIGSVGILAAHVDESGADEIAGRKWTLVHAGARKADGNPHEPLPDRALATIQADVDALHAELCSLVAGNGLRSRLRPASAGFERSAAAMRLAGAFRRTIAVQSFTEERRRPGPAPASPEAGARWGRPSGFEIGHLAAPRDPDPTITYSWLHEVVRHKGIESHRQFAEAELGADAVAAEAIRSVTFYLGQRQVRHERSEVKGGATSVTLIIETIRHYVRLDFPFQLAGTRGAPHPPPTPPREEPEHG